MKGIIYKATNTFDGSSYIGATTNSIHQRKLDHIERANRGENGQLYEAITTYGVDAFTRTQIDTANSTDELAQKEKEYILEYNSKKEGYNKDSGGGFKKSVYQYDFKDGSLIKQYNGLEEASDVINSSKQHISRACLSVNNTFGGFYWSYEYKVPFKPKMDSRKREVYQLSLNGQLLAKYVSVSEASRQSGVSKTCISRVCRGERKFSGGYMWKYIT